MEITDKIQCPTCGATSSCPETDPDHYKCRYCLSVWEQSSVFPEENTQHDFLKKCEEIFDEQLNLKREHPKYFELSYANISIFYTFFLEIENPEYRELLLPKFFTLLDKQISEYTKQGIDENVDRDKVFLKHTDNFVLIIYLAEINYMAAKVIALNYEGKEKLEEVFQKLKTAQRLHGPTIDEWQEKISKTVVGILQRLGNQEKTFKYIHSLAENQSVGAFKAYHKKSSGFAPDEDDVASFIKHQEEYKDEISILFEDIIFSEEYEAWEAKNVPIAEPIKEKEETSEPATEKIFTEPGIMEETDEPIKPKKRSFWQKLFRAD